MKRLILLAALTFVSIFIHAQPGTLDFGFNSTDIGFDNGAGPNSFLWTTAIQNDGKILIGGNFTSYSGIGLNHIARLNVDGTPDSSFHTGSGTDISVRSIVLQNDGRI